MQDEKPPVEGEAEPENTAERNPPGNRRRAAPGYRRKDGTWEIVPTPDKIRAARIGAGLTQEEAGKLVHVSRKGWQKWELGERHMPPGIWDLFLNKVADKLQDGGFFG